MIAYVNHGRWVADCSVPHCPEAHQVKPGDGFLCRNCGGEDIPVFPEFRSEIDQLLAMRPVPETRNWWPGETVSDLIAENQAHGLVGREGRVV